MLHSFLLFSGTVLLAFAFAACQASAPGVPEASAADGLAASTLVYVGTSSGAADEGIYALRFDPATGALHLLGKVAEVMNPSFLARSPDARTLYAVSESSGMGSVVAFRIDSATGALEELNRQATGGAGPAHVSTNGTGDWVLVANYGGGSVALLPVEEDGRLGEATDVVQHTGSGPDAERQEGPHAHFIHTGPDGRYAYAADLGIDRVRIYPLDAERGSLSAESVQEVTTAPGAGPRHLDFHPSGRYAYLVGELLGTVTAYALDATTGALTEMQTLSTLPEAFDGYNKSADIHVHPSGRWLYVSNRGDLDSIAIFSIDQATGRLTLAGHQQEGIRWPRHFAFDPTGRYLLVANRRANEVRVFTLDPETGRLTPTDHHADVPEPTNVTFMAPAD